MTMKTNRPPAVMPTYNRYDVAFERGEGCYLFDEKGQRYLDFCSGIAVTALGHCHPHLVKALVDQGGKLWHTSNLYKIPLQEKLAQRLAAATFADSVFFTNSGVEAIEACLKVARKYHYDRGAPGRNRVITFENSFHGRTLAAISASGKEKLVKGFGPLLEGFDRVPFIDLEAVAAAIGEATAAILVEPVQGEGGIVPAKPAELKALRELCDRHGLLLIFDEIQCGMGRSGKLFACDWAGVEPDLMALAKGLGGGFPLGACLARGTAGETLSVGSHGTTFGGNPLAMAVGNAVLDILLADGLFEHVVAMTALLMKGLAALKAKHPGIIREVRGLGLMIGIECAVEVRPLIVRGLELGLVSAPSGTHIIRLLPPLIVEEEHIEEALGKLDLIFSQA